MTDHTCIHEVDLALMAARQVAMQNEQQEQGRDIKDILNVLKGNGKPGLCTDVALIKQKQSWMWAGVGATGTGVLGLIGWTIKVIFGG